MKEKKKNSNWNILTCWDSVRFSKSGQLTLINSDVNTVGIWKLGILNIGNGHESLALRSHENMNNIIAMELTLSCITNLLVSAYCRSLYFSLYFHTRLLAKLLIMKFKNI